MDNKQKKSNKQNCTCSNSKKWQHSKDVHKIKRNENWELQNVGYLDLITLCEY